MNILFIDTHAEKVDLQILYNGIITKKEKISDRSHSEIVVPLINELLNELKITLKDINEIIVVNGPGSFTGERIGVTIAKTIGYCLNIPIKTISSIESYGVSSNEKNGLVVIYDTKGVFYSEKTDNKFSEINYLSKSEFETKYAKDIIQYNVNDLNRIINYLKGKDYTNPHAVNPIYIKQIEVLK